MRSRLLPALLLLLVSAAACGPPRFPPPKFPAHGDVHRGTYLAEHVALCVTCHSERDWRYFGGPHVVGTEGTGGALLNELFKIPDEVSIPATNITPAAIGDWTDAEIGRAIAGGLRADGTSIFPGHPYFQFRHLARDDLAALVAWTRTLAPAERDLPARDLVYRQVQQINDALPSAPALRKAVPAGEIGRGRYLAEVASCKYCHTPTDRLGFPLAGREWAGGSTFAVAPPGAGRVVVPNITPHATGIGGWTREDFVNRFRNARPDIEVTEGGFNSPMPWSAYSGMTDEDLGAIHAFLVTRRPIRNALPRYEPP